MQDGCESIECTLHMYGFGRLSLHIGLLQGSRHVMMVVPEMAEGVQSGGLPDCTGGMHYFNRSLQARAIHQVSLQA